MSDGCDRRWLPAGRVARKPTPARHRPPYVRVRARDSPDWHAPGPSHRESEGAAGPAARRVSLLPALPGWPPPSPLSRRRGSADWAMTRELCQRLGSEKHLVRIANYPAPAEIADPVHNFHGTCTGVGQIAAVEDQVRSGLPQIRQDRLKRGSVAVDVGRDCDAHRNPLSN